MGVGGVCLKEMVKVATAAAFNSTVAAELLGRLEDELSNIIG